MRLPRPYGGQGEPANLTPLQERQALSGLPAARTSPVYVLYSALSTLYPPMDSPPWIG